VEVRAGLGSSGREERLIATGKRLVKGTEMDNSLKRPNEV